MHQNDTRKAHK